MSCLDKVQKRYYLNFVVGAHAQIVEGTDGDDLPTFIR